MRSETIMRKGSSIFKFMKLASGNYNMFFPSRNGTVSSLLCLEWKLWCFVWSLWCFVWSLWSLWTVWNVEFTYEFLSCFVTQLIACIVYDKLFSSPPKTVHIMSVSWWSGIFLRTQFLLLLFPMAYVFVEKGSSIYDKCDEGYRLLFTIILVRDEDLSQRTFYSHQLSIALLQAYKHQRPCSKELIIFGCSRVPLNT